MCFYTDKKPFKWLHSAKKLVHINFIYEHLNFNGYTNELNLLRWCSVDNFLLCLVCYVLMINDKLSYFLGATIVIDTVNTTKPHNWTVWHIPDDLSNYNQ